MAKKNLANALGAFTSPAATSTPAQPMAAPQSTTPTTYTTETPAKVKKINQTIQFEPEFAREVKVYAAANGLTLRELVLSSLREYMAAH